MKKTHSQGSPYINVLNGFDPGMSNVTNYALPSYGIDLNNSDGYRAINHSISGVSSAGIYSAQLMRAGIVADPAKTFNFQDFETLIMSYAIMIPAASYLDNDTTWQETAVSATECGLYLCLHAYNTSVTLSVLNESKIATSRHKVPTSWQPMSKDYQPHVINIKNQSAIGTLTWNPIFSEGYLKRYDFQMDATKLDLASIMPSDMENIACNATQSFLDSTADLLGVDFSTLDGHPDGTAAVWIGEGEGETIFQIQSYQQRIMFTATSAFVMYSSPNLTTASLSA